jgi:hypothetical protein
MAPFVTSEESGQQVWSGKVIPDFACKSRSGYPLGRLFLCECAFNPRKVRETDV